MGILTFNKQIIFIKMKLLLTILVLSVFSNNVFGQAVQPTGTCPAATTFGMVNQTAATYSDKSICSGLTTTCCTSASMKLKQAAWTTWSKNASAYFWSVSKLPNMVGILLSNMNS